MESLVGPSEPSFSPTTNLQHIVQKCRGEVTQDRTEAIYNSKAKSQELARTQATLLIQVDFRKFDGRGKSSSLGFLLRQKNLVGSTSKDELLVVLHEDLINEINQQLPNPFYVPKKWGGTSHVWSYT